MAITYTRNEERANYLTHSLGVIIILIAFVYFISKVHYAANPYMYIAGFLLYAFGALSSYLASALYHSSPFNSNKRGRLRKLDHAAIYWHIAGSYSPITLAGMYERQEWGWGLFITIWLCAVLGSFVSFKGLKEHSNVETACFVAMGLLVLLAFNVVLDCIGWGSMQWILAEGASFIIGAVFYSFNKIKYMHTVFHVFVLLGSIFHILAMYYMLH